jgi:amino-acid N-acetyltransferase
MIIRKAVLKDATSISTLVNMGEREGQLLPRSLDLIRASIGNWIVAEENGQVIGCGSLLEIGPTLSEVRSLAVAPAQRGRGIGVDVVRALIQEARERKIPVLFALTRAVGFFEKLGFTVTVKEDFPEKVWRDCMICPVREACDEVAVVLPLNHIPWAMAENKMSLPSKLLSEAL